MRRGELLRAIGAVASAPLAARAQLRAMPVLGFLSSGTRTGLEHLMAAFRQGLGEAGFVEGSNVAIEYHWANGQYARLPAMAADLVRRRVTVVLARTTPAALAAKKGDLDHPDCLHGRRRPDCNWVGGQSKPAKQQRNRQP